MVVRGDVLALDEVIGSRVLRRVEIGVMDLEALVDRVTRLALAGRLSWVELRLMHAVLERLRLRLDYRREVDMSPRAFAWDVPGDWDDTRKLSWFLTLLMPRARAGKIRREVMSVMLAACQSGLVTIATEKVANDPYVTNHFGYPGLVKKTRAAIKELQALLAKG